MCRGVGDVYKRHMPGGYGVLMGNLVKLQEWADEVYTTPPSLSTLRRWTREGRIY
ncbi:excisionase, partial [Enterobacter hormaechei]